MEGAYIQRLEYDFHCEISHCGSRVTCNPAPTDTDDDWLVFVDDHTHLSQMVERLTTDGWRWEGATEHYQNVASNTFMSWRRDNDNLIVTTNRDFARLHKVATRICTRLNLMQKADRIMVFQAVLYGNTEHGL